MSADPGPSYTTPTTRPKQTVAYFYDGDVGNYSYGYGHPMKPHRMRMTHNLVVNYGLDRHMDILRPKRASREQMAAFHTDEYVDFLNRVSPETMNDLTGDGTRYLIGEDCPAFEGLWEFCTISAGGSLAAAERINSGQADVAINWAGGLHHAKKREASGFCYVNDIVLGILELLRTHLRVLYIDIDIHHGDGVEEAFYTTDRVLTVSFHKFGDFFPGTGDVRDIGMKKGKGYAVNVPLKDGVDEKEFGGIFRPVLQHIMDWYRPGAVVLQCGADSLAGDKLGCFNLSMKGHADCVRFMQSFDVPLVCLGGGGYTIRNVAKTWTYETGLLVHKDLDENLPFNEYIQYFGPEYKLDVPPTSMENQNSREYIEGLKARVIDNLRSLPSAPSVQMQEVPRSLNIASIELSDDEDSDLDERISRKLRDAHVERYGDELSGDEDAWDQDGGLSDMGSAAGNLSRRGSASTTKRAFAANGGGNTGLTRGLSGKNAATYSFANGNGVGGPGLGPGIAGGRRGSAPWKNSAANHDLAAKFGSSSNGGAMRPRLGPFDDNAQLNGFYAGAGRHSQSEKPKRNFFAARAAGLAKASAAMSNQRPVAPLSSTIYDDFDTPSALINGHGAGTPAAPATAHPSAANSEAPGSPVPSSAMRDSPMVS